MSNARGFLLLAASAIAAPSLSSASDGGPGAGLEEVVVTAQRRETALQDTPLAVSAFTESDLRDRQIGTAFDVIQYVPNLAGNHNTGPGTANSYWLRGVGNGESLATFDVPVGTYVDDIYIARQNANEIYLLDVERIEVLRGPQGTLFGRNTTGGAISVVTRKPSAERSLRADLAYGSFQRTEVRLNADLPLSQQVLTKLSAFRVEDDGPVRSVTNGARLNGDDSWGVRGALRFLPRDGIEWNLSADYSSVARLNQGTALIPGRTAAGDGESASVAGDFLKAYTDSRSCREHGDYVQLALQKCGFNYVTTRSAASNLVIDTGLGALQFITGYRHARQTFNIDFLDNHPLQPFGPFVGPHFYIANDGTHSQWSQEAKLTGAARGDGLRYTVGAFYMDERNHTRFADLIGVPTFVLVDRDLRNDTRSYAAYGQLEYDFAPAWTAIVGARWTREEKELDLLYEPTFGAPFTEDALPAFGYAPEQTTTKTTPKVALQYRPRDGVMLYASATNGFKSGGWNARTDNPQLLNDFGPEKVWSYEVGARTEMLERRLRVNATLFQARYSDLQIATQLPGTSAFVTTNAGDSRVRGAELEVTAAPLADLTLFANLGLQDAEFTRLSADALATGFTDRTVPLRSPDYTLSAGVTWGLPLSSGARFVLTADANLTDDYYFDYPNLPDQAIDQPLLWNASVRYVAASGAWDAALECRNCGDEHWSTSNLFSLAYPADPLQWMLRLNFSWQ